MLYYRYRASIRGRITTVERKKPALTQRDRQQRSVRAGWGGAEDKTQTLAAVV